MKKHFVQSYVQILKQRTAQYNYQYQLILKYYFYVISLCSNGISLSSKLKIDRNQLLLELHVEQRLKNAEVNGLT